MENLKEQSLKSLVLAHHEYIPVLEKYSLDFCCRGAKTLNEASIEKNISIDTLLEELTHAIKKNCNAMPFSEMTAEQLISYIQIHHHFYVRNTIPTIKNHLDKIVTKHGPKYPNMIEVAQLFDEVAAELLTHMDKEEQILFPRIKNLFSSNAAKNAAALATGYIDNPVHVMEAEHEKAGDILYAIRSLTNGYTPPETACTTHRVCLEELKAFESDLHQHVHLENNILFPMAQMKAH
jgi:regulator of cell morphogenesis and NO signaling